MISQDFSADVLVVLSLCGHCLARRDDLHREVSELEDHQKGGNLMQMYIMLGEKITDGFDGTVESAEQAVDAMVDVCTCNVVIMGRSECGKSFPLHPTVERLAFIRNLSECNCLFPTLAFCPANPAVISPESVLATCDPYDIWNSCVNDCCVNFAHFMHEFQMRTCVHLAESNHGYWGEPLPLQKVGILTENLFMPGEMLLPHPIHTKVSIVMTSDNRLIVSDRHVYFLVQMPQLRREQIFFCTTRKVSGYLVESCESECGDFSSGFMILTYNYILPRCFCAFLYHTLAL